MLSASSRDPHRPSLSPPFARIASIILLGLLAFGFWRNVGAIQPVGKPNSDVDLNTRTIERIRAGEPYYDAVGDELRRGEYPTKPVINWRTPLFYEYVATVSIPAAASILTILGIAAIILGAMARGFWGAIMVTGAVLPALLMRPAGVVLSEVLCGVLLTISIGLYYRSWWLPAALCGLAALFIRELAFPYAAVCGCLALLSKRRTESLVWILGGIAYVVYYGLHAHAAYGHMQAGDLVRQQSYLGSQGYRFVLSTIRVNGFLLLLPAFLTPIAPVAGLAGMAAPEAPRHLVWSVLAFALVFCLVGQPFGFYWGFVTVGLWGYAFTYTPAGARSLLAAWRPTAASAEAP